MKKLLIVFGMLFTISPLYGQSWVAVSGKHENKKNFSYDMQSVKSYPGLVVFNTRHEVTGGRLFYFHKLAYMCGSKEIRKIASFLDANKESKQSFSPEVNDYGVIEHMAVPNLVNQISKSCGTRFSRDDIEIVLTATNDEVTITLPKETILKGNTVVMWHKIYPYVREPIIIDGKELKIDDEVYYNYKIQKNIGYKLISWEFDCTSKSSGALSTVEYDVHGNVRSSSDFSKIKALTFVVPGSVGKTALDFACSLR